MEKKLESKLYKKYPKIFRQKDLDTSQTCMCWGICVGDGWYNIIDELCSGIQHHCDQNDYVAIKDFYYYWVKVYNFFIERKFINKLFCFLLRKKYIFNKNLHKKEQERLQVEAAQVKEKFGGLRFYVNFADEYTYGMIGIIEGLSYKICEHCGSMKNVSQNKRGWIKTLCRKCRKGDQENGKQSNNK